MKKWKIPVTWDMHGELEIVAETIEEAIKLAEEHPYWETLPDGECFSGSWSVETDVEIVKEYQYE